MYTNEHWIIRLRLEDSGREITSEKTKLLIGRTTDCDLSFPENSNISRLHAEIFLRNGMWYIVDRGSTNGTWVGGEKLIANKEVALKPNDVIDLAHKLKVVFVESREPASDRVIVPEKEPQPKKYCRMCGAEVKGRFCGSCGSIVENAPIAQKTVQPPVFSSAAPKPCAPSMYAAPMPPMPAPVMPSMALAPQAAPMPAAAAQKSVEPKKKGIFSKLFGGKTSEPAAPEPAPPAVDDVQFRGTAPESIRPGEYFPVKIMMYREDDYQRADRESAAVADRAKSASSSVFQAAHGQQFRITLQSPDIEVDCESQDLKWTGKFATADFEVYLPENYDRRQLRLRGRVYSDNAVLTDLKLILQVGAAQPQSVVCEKVRLRSAFISYASADRAKVVARIQGIQLACPDMDLFFDVESLRRGEHWETRLYQEISSRDLFYLFWSNNAAASDWVQKELRYAVAQKSTAYIEPIPLEGPEVCSPPACLGDKHFNDWTLRYLNNQ